MLRELQLKIVRNDSQFACSFLVPLCTQHNPHSRIPSTDKTPKKNNKKGIEISITVLEAGGVSSGSIP